MALGATTYKTPNIINRIGTDFTSKEGCGVHLFAANSVAVTTTSDEPPYGIIVAGCDSVDGTYPGPVAASALELVDQLGCVVQVTISSEDVVSAGQFLYIDSSVQDGTFTHVYAPNLSVGEWVWGLALTDASPNEQCLMRFQPYQIQYIAP